MNDLTPGGSAVPDPGELAMLRDTVRGWLGGAPSLEQAGEMGLLGLLTPEAAGGSGWRPAEACVVAEEAGRALSGLNWAANLVAATALASQPERPEAVAAVLAGTREVALARRDALSVDAAARVSGRLEVSGTQPSLLLVLGAAGPLLVDCSHRGVGLEAGAGVDPNRPSCRLTLESVPAERLEGADAVLLEQAACLVSCADTLGALSATADLVRGHLVERLAFERPLASFQALQHRLADLAVLEAACDSLVRRAARTLQPGTDARVRARAVAGTHSYFARHATAALDDCIQLAGGIGFTWEFPAHLAMRRSLVNSFWSRDRQLSTDALGAPAAAESPDGAAAGFRARVRAVIEAERPFEMREGHRAPADATQEADMRRWYRTLFDHRILGASWPPEWGGDPGHHPRHDLIVTEELIRARAPRPIDQVQLAAHVLLRFGTEEQKARYLPRIRSAEDIWCQLFSEPDCGSDLAGIKARAELQGDGRWRLAGQKTWTTDGHWAQMGVALLRTGHGLRRHHGLTAFVVPMDTPGLSVQPKMTIGGAYEFNDVFLDGATLGPEHVLGAVGEGWAVAMSGLEIERFGVGGNVLLLDLLLGDLWALVTSVPAGGLRLAERGEVRAEMAALASEAAAARSFLADHVEQALAGTERPGDASVAKLLYSETYNRISRYGATLVAEHGPVPESATGAAQRLGDAWLWSRALTISGGSSEVMRNIIAKRRLALPQE